MKALRFYALLFLLFMITACKKKSYPESEVIENPAVYYTKLTMDNSPLTLEAGVNGYYMYSSYKYDSASILAFVADLKEANCTICTNSLKIQLYDYRASSALYPSSIDSTLQLKKYPFTKVNPEPQFSVKFNAEPGATTYFWNFGDGNTSTLQSPVNVFKKAGKYNVSLKTTTGTCESTIYNKEKIDLNPSSCKTSITAVPGPSNTINFTSTTMHGAIPYKYLWSFGDGTTFNQANFIKSYKYRGAYAVSLRVIDALGDTAYANYNAKTLSDVYSCAANYNKTNLPQVANPLPLSQILISWVDSNGITYTTNGDQPSDSYFEILSVKDGEINENQQPTKKVTARFKCKVFNGAKSIDINDAQIVISIAYKK